MTSPRLYVPVREPIWAPGVCLNLPPDAARHAQVRRVQPGDEVRVFDGRGSEFSAVVQTMGRKDVSVCLTQPVAVDAELPMAVTLAVGMPANERMDTLVEKATELGVAAIQPLQCERSVLRVEGERAIKKCAHWQAVAVAASEQCGRAVVPVVEPVRGLNEWLTSLPQGFDPAPLRWVLSLSSQAATPGRFWQSSQGLQGGAGVQGRSRVELYVLSGPEGGLSPVEEAAAGRCGFEPVHLGPRVLRADTAPLAVLAWLGLNGLA